MKYVIRRIAAEEWRELRAIRLASLLDSPDAFDVRHADAVALPDRAWREQAERAATAPDDGLFVAVDETGSWAGTAGAAPLDDIPDTAHVHAVYVAPAHRGPDGPARALMEAAVDFAREHIDRAQLTLGVREDNHRAMAFYRRIGFGDLGKTVPSPLDPTKALRILGCPDFRPLRVPDEAPAGAAASARSTPTGIVHDPRPRSHTIEVKQSDRLTGRQKRTYRVCMTDTQPDVLSPRDEARLELSSRARTLAEGAGALVPVEIDPEPGSLITRAKELLGLAEELLSAAVVAERERGLSPEKIRALTARPYWGRTVLAWVEEGRRNHDGVPGPALARGLDEWASRGNPDVSRPVTDGLDATRFPGSAQYEAHQRDRVAGLYKALAEAQQERAEAWHALNELTEEDCDGSGVDHEVNVRVVAACRSLASLYRDLSTADPAFAHEYVEEAASFESTADRLAKEGPFG